MTSLHKLASLPEVASFLRPDVTLLGLQQLARELTDVQAAEELREAPPGAVQAGNPTPRRSPWTTRHFDHRPQRAAVLGVSAGAEPTSDDGEVSDLRSEPFHLLCCCHG